MRYVYNAERDRILYTAWEPHFMIATYKEIETGEERGKYLCACTSNAKQQRTVSEKFTLPEETFVGYRTISKDEFTKWLCNGKDVISYKGTDIPADYALMYFVAEDAYHTGDLSLARAALINENDNVLMDLASSYEKSGEKFDIVREEPDLEL